MMGKGFHGGRRFMRMGLFMVCFMLFFPACSGGGDDARQERAVYVSEQRGNDGAGKGTQDSPWKTIEKGISELGKDGKDTLVIRAGFYPVPNEIQLRRSGSPERPLVIRSAPGEKVVLSDERNGVTDNTGRFVFNIKRDDSHRGLEHITIEGIHFTGGVSVGGSKQTCKDIHIRGCTFTAHGADLGPNNPTLINFRCTEDCSVRNCRIFCDDPKRNDFSGIKVWRCTKRLLVEGNEIYGLARKGIDNKHGLPDQELVIRNNYIHHLSERAINVNGDKTIVENNVMYRCYAGVNVWKESGSPGGSFSIIDHNTIVDCDMGIMLEPESSGKLRGCRVTNNLLVNCGTDTFCALNISPYRGEPYDHDHYINHNAYYHVGRKRHVRDRDDALHTLREWRAVSGLDGASIEKDPGFLITNTGISPLCGFRVSDEFSTSGETRGDDGCTMGANIVSMTDGGCRLMAYASGDSVGLRLKKNSGSPEADRDKESDTPLIPRNVRVGVQ